VKGYDLSLQSGALLSFGVYESIEVDSGVLFHLDDHIERLFESARIIELSIGQSQSTIRRWVTELIERDQITEALLRIMVFGPNGDETLSTPTYAIAPLSSTFLHPRCRAITFKGAVPCHRPRR